MGGGTCCKLNLRDHRLYVSVGELALLTLESPPAPQRAWRCHCLSQVGPECTAYRRRPLGCRVFFCRKKLGGAPIFSASMSACTARSGVSTKAVGSHTLTRTCRE